MGKNKQKIADAPLYEPFKVKMGILNKEKVMAIKMPREDFIEMVEALIETYKDDLSKETIETLRETAETMPNFPLNTWVNKNRGCGCLIGEYLVATEELGRDNVVNRFSEFGDDSWAVADMLRARVGNGEAYVLECIGEQIDSDLRDYLYEHDAFDLEHELDSVVIFA